LLVGEHVLYFKNVDIDLFGCSPGTWCQVWAKIYKLTTQVATADTVSIDGIWARGRLSSGCRLIDESLNYHYDAHFFASAASVRTAGPWIAEFTSYTYHLFDQQGGNPLRWFPFDPTDSLATFRLDYSFVANTDPASVSSDALRADGQPRVVAWMKQEEVVFQFRVDGVGPSTVAIFDVGGREVRVLHSEASAGPGLRAVRWDQRNSAGRRVPSGVYFARVWATGEKGRGSGWPARVVIVR
jgi:hypothetical protein